MYIYSINYKQGGNSMNTFTTTDGYKFTLVDNVWTDGDMEFNNKDGLPVDCFGEVLEGELSDV